MKKSCIGLALIVSIFFSSCGGGISEEKMASGKKVYQTYCQACHMDEGGGVPRMNAALKGSPYVAGDKEKLISIVLHGSQAFGNDPSRHYQNTMPPQATLTDEQIADVLTYVRNSFSNKGSAIEPADVKTVREKK
jgi:mono/diheme cytochrome c family protein